MKKINKLMRRLNKCFIGEIFEIGVFLKVLFFNSSSIAELKSSNAFSNLFCFNKIFPL